MIIALFLCGFVAVAAVIGFVALKSPIGYEDQKGFHFARQNSIVRRKASDISTFPSKNPIAVIFQQSWARPMKWAALVILSLALFHTGFETSNNTTVASVNIPSKPAKSESHRRNDKSVFVPAESSKLFSEVCQRFTEIE